MAEKKLEAQMGRGDFFKWGLQSIKNKTIETALKSLNQINSLASVLGEKWEKVALFAQLSERPKSIFLQGRAFYLVLIASEIKAYAMNCPIDAKPLQWQEHLQQFHCLHCQRAFNREGHSLKTDQDVRLQECTVKCEDGIVYLKVN